MNGDDRREFHLVVIINSDLTIDWTAMNGDDSKRFHLDNLVSLVEKVPSFSASGAKRCITAPLGVAADTNTSTNVIVIKRQGY